MKLYEIFETKLNCEGVVIGQNRIGLYISKEKAYAFKEYWEYLWQRHMEQSKAVYPCWMDTKSKLRIKESITND